MEICQECSSLPERLSRVNDQYVSLLLQEERMEREGFRETSTFGVVEHALREAENERGFVSQLLVDHRGKHDQTRTAWRLQPVPNSNVEMTAELKKGGPP